MNFDYTYIILFGYIIFEPMTILTNLLIFIFSIYCFKSLAKINHPYSTSFSWFVLLVGISSCFGSLAHAVHYQSGKVFFDVVFYISNALSLVSIFFCFKSAYLYYTNDKINPHKKITYLVIAWVVGLLIFALIKNNFVIIKINAGIVLVYSIVSHYLVYRKTNDKGSVFVISGIGVSFLSIIVHSLKLSINEWFNYKDIAHVIIFFSLILIYKGVKLNAMKLKLLTK
ncbi:MAG: hypothetical protein Q7W45_16820 [Bacteroidota bacterium]|nr:hypothetical protein [Bacteroidota bacterium]MDP3145323.1 hypothetical protein [Bacteroidota bacterium]